MGALQALSFVRAEHLDIPAAHTDHTAWLLAMKELHKLNNYKVRPPYQVQWHARGGVMSQDRRHMRNFIPCGAGASVKHQHSAPAVSQPAASADMLALLLDMLLLAGCAAPHARAAPLLRWSSPATGRARRRRHPGTSWCASSIAAGSSTTCCTLATMPAPMAPTVCPPPPPSPPLLPDLLPFDLHAHSGILCAA